MSRTLPILSDFSVTVWEWKQPAQVVNDYWETQGRLLSESFSSRSSSSHNVVLDPFGLVTWPGSVKAAQELHRHAEIAVKDKHVVVFGAGVGVEAQVAAILGAKQVVATDIHPTTLEQLAYGVAQEPRIPPGVVRTQLLDLFATAHEQPVPMPCDLLVVADVLYNDQLATQVCRRCAEALQQNPSIRILISDSQRFVPTFIEQLNSQCSLAGDSSSSDECQGFKMVDWQTDVMKQFTGSGVVIDDECTYDVKVQFLWIGL
jgi:predicted nicotinamide N-methyase